MKQAGNYNYQFVWLVQSETQVADGTNVESWADSSTLWATLEQPNGREQYLYGLLGTFTDAKIRVRGKVAIKGKDRMRENSSNDVYHIEGVTYSYDDDETVLIGYKWRD